MADAKKNCGGDLEWKSGIDLGCWNNIKDSYGEVDTVKVKGKEIKCLDACNRQENAI